MEVDKLNRLLSYLIVIPIESVSSKWNAELHIQMYKGRYRLTTANAIYSFEDKYDNFRGAFQLVDWNAFRPGKVLVLGLGLGSVIQILETVVGIHPQYTCIEIDEMIVHLAEKYILWKIEAKPEIIIGSAQNFLDSTQEKYDLILMDIFQDDAIPVYYESKTFLQQAAHTLSPGGLLVYNRLGFTGKDKIASKKFFKNSFQSVFPSSVCKFIHHNYMLFNHPHYFISGPPVSE